MLLGVSPLAGSQEFALEVRYDDFWRQCEGQLSITDPAAPLLGQDDSRGLHDTAPEPQSQKRLSSQLCWPTPRPKFSLASHYAGSLIESPAIFDGRPAASNRMTLCVMEYAKKTSPKLFRSALLLLRARKCSNRCSDALVYLRSNGLVALAD